jgi:hypothetical protein
MTKPANNEVEILLNEIDKEIKSITAQVAYLQNLCSLRELKDFEIEFLKAVLKNLKEVME